MIYLFIERDRERVRMLERAQWGGQRQRERENV